LLDEVFKHLDLLERDYFAISFKDSEVLVSAQLLVLIAFNIHWNLCLGVPR